MALAVLACAAMALALALGAPPLSSFIAKLSAVACLALCVFYCARSLGGGRLPSSPWEAYSRGLRELDGNGPNGDPSKGDVARSVAARHAYLPLLLAAALGVLMYAACATFLRPGLQAVANLLATLAVLPAGVAFGCASCLLWASGAFRQEAAHAMSEAVRLAAAEGVLKPSALPTVPDSLSPALADNGNATGLRALSYAVLLAAGAALCTALPDNLPANLAAQGTCASIGCLALAALFAFALRRMRARYAAMVEELKTETKRELDIARARKAATDAEHMASEAARAVKVANQRASETGSTPSIESSCILAASRFNLSKREQEVLVLMAMGRTRPRIAEDLVLSLSTVNSHVQKIYRKMGIHSNQELLDLLEELR